MPPYGDCAVLSVLTLAGWPRNWPMHTVCLFDPFANSVMRVLESLGIGRAIRHAAGKVGNAGNEAAAIFLGEGLHDHCVIRNFHWSPPSPHL